MINKVAVIDIGSNTIKLVIYIQSNKELMFKELLTVKVRARLKEHLNESDILTTEGFNILVETLQYFKHILNKYKVKNITCIATATLRSAKNFDYISNSIREKTSLIINVLTEYEEAYYGYFAIKNTINKLEGVTIDIGGASTEITHFKQRKIINYHSFPFGVLSLKFKFIKGTLPTPEERKNMQKFVFEHMKRVPWILDIGSPIITIGGSAKTIMKFHLHYSKHPLQDIHYYEVKGSDIYNVYKILSNLSLDELKQEKSIPKDRLDTIFPAIEILNELINVSNSDTIIYNNNGLREGILFSRYDMLMDNGVSKQINYFMGIINKNKIDVKNISNLSKIVYKYIDLFIKNKKYVFESDELFLMYGSHLFNLGGFIMSNLISLQNFNYLISIKNINMSHKDRVKLALIASFYNESTFKKMLKPFEKWFTNIEILNIFLLGSIVKLAFYLHKSKIRELFISVNTDMRYMKIKLITNNEFVQDIDKEKYELEKITNIKINFILNP